MNANLQNKFNWWEKKSTWKFTQKDKPNCCIHYISFYSMWCDYRMSALRRCEHALHRSANTLHTLPIGNRSHSIRVCNSAIKKIYRRVLMYQQTLEILYRYFVCLFLFFSSFHHDVEFDTHTWQSEVFGNCYAKYTRTTEKYVLGAWCSVHLV